MAEIKFDHYMRLKKAIAEWMYGHDTTSVMAQLLSVSPSSLRSLLGWYGLAEVDGTPVAYCEVQDVFNALILGKLQLQERQVEINRNN